MKFKLRHCTIILTGLLAACSSNDNSDEPIQSTNPNQTASNYEQVACRDLSNPAITIAGRLGDDSVDCGLVRVPANWAVPEGESIRIAVYRIPSTAENPAADPVVYLEGGPGGSGAASVSDFVSGPAAYLRQRADVIIVDQRGTGYSEPALYCSEVFATDALGGQAGNIMAAHQACHDRFVTDGVDFSNFNSANNARDITAVREALGYAQWNLYGLSYGTRLALTTLRDAPTGIRSVILDSVFPIEINGLSETPFTYYWAIEQIASNCAADADCAATIGDMKSLIEQGIARLVMTPGAFSANDYLQVLAESIAEPELPILISTVASASDADLSNFLNAISEAAEEDNDGLPSPDQAPSEFYPFVADAEGMGYAVICAEEAPFLATTAGPDIAADFQQTTQDVVSALPTPFDSALCSVYTVPPAADIETQAVASDIPTLVLAGTADAITPPAWSILAADALANAQYAEFAGLSHGLLGNNACLSQITRAFLDSPTSAVDQSCINDLPRVDYITQ